MGIPPTNPHPPQSSSFYDPHFLKLLLVLGVRLETEPIIDPRNWRFGPQYEYNIFAIVSCIRRKEVGRSTQSRQCLKNLCCFHWSTFHPFTCYVEFSMPPTHGCVFFPDFIEYPMYDPAWGHIFFNFL